MNIRQSEKLTKKELLSHVKSVGKVKVEYFDAISEYCRLIFHYTSDDSLKYKLDSMGDKGVLLSMQSISEFPTSEGQPWKYESLIQKEDIHAKIQEWRELIG